MEPVRRGGTSTGAVALAIAILVAVATAAMVQVGGGFAHPLVTAPGHFAAARPAPAAQG